MNSLIIRQESFRGMKRDENRIPADLTLSYLFGHLKIGRDTVPITQNPLTKYRPWISSIKTSYNKGDPNGHQISFVGLEENEETELSKIKEIHQDVACFELINVGKLNHLSVTARKNYKKGDYIGQFTGTFLTAEEIMNRKINNSSLEIIVNGNIFGVIDGSNDRKNWVKYISKARNPMEQNVEAIFDGSGSFIYSATRDIFSGEEFLMWLSGRDWFDYLCTPGDMSKFSNTYPFNSDPKLMSEPRTIEESTPLSKDTSDGTFTMNGVNSNSYACAKCGRTFSSQNYLNRHMQYTSCVDDCPSRTFACTQCSRKFQREERLKVHVKQVHEGHRPYRCQSCNKTFSQSSSLTKHMRTHTGERPYKCKFCSKGFSASSILTTHIRQHTGEKPFRCPFCPKDFHSHAAHHSHMKRVHKVEPGALRAQRTSAS
ncbi:PR domain zinc finger protein 14 [Thelohanellus kitauei]|uniref:PR domain zinc finger protein 14 n=1 Tax=Thelohanellus kitauei TaxID=669202 RepID=A0A0C2N2Y3_THEKT|nr:PR domain zinc finger protein 14 [Thelohanellus kitauei]